MIIYLLTKVIKQHLKIIKSPLHLHTLHDFWWLKITHLEIVTLHVVRR